MGSFWIVSRLEPTLFWSFHYAGIFLILTELVSILENLSELGMKLPMKLVSKVNREYEKFLVDNPTKKWYNRINSSLNNFFRRWKMRRRKRRRRRLTKHHIINRINGGAEMPENIILLTEQKHECWHEIFGNLSFIEAARVLIRADKLKRRKRCRSENVSYATKY